MSYGGLRGGVGFSLVNMIPIAVGKFCLMYIVQLKINYKQFFILVHVQNIKGTVLPDWICMRVVPLDRP